MKILDESSLSNIEKVDLWHAGKRKENIKACGEAKLEDFYRIAKSRGYSEILDAIDSECRRRGIPLFGTSPASRAKAVKIEPSVRDVNKAEEITDKIFKVLIRSIKYILENDLRDLINDEYESSYEGGDWPSSAYKNVKQQEWILDWEDKYFDYGTLPFDDGQIADIESEIIQKYQDKILPVIDVAKDEIIAKYKSKDSSLVPLVEKILDTVDIFIGNHSIFDPKEDNFEGEVLLQLEAQLPD